MCSTPADGSAECVHGQCRSRHRLAAMRAQRATARAESPATTYRITVFLPLRELAGARDVLVHRLDQLVDRVELQHAPDMGHEVDPHVLTVKVEVVQADGV